MLTVEEIMFKLWSHLRHGLITVEEFQAEVLRLMIERAPG